MSLRLPADSTARTALLAAAVVALGVALRLVDAGTRINEDEGYSWLVATAPTATSFLARLAHYENTPPLFYLLLEPLKPDSPILLRVPSIVGGSAAVAVVFLWLRAAFDRLGPAVFGALALAISPLSVSYADYSRGFMLVEFELLAALMALEQFVSRPAQHARKAAWLYCIAGACAMYTEYYAGLFLAPAIALAVWCSPGRRRSVLLLGCVPLVLFGAWVPELLRQAHDAGQTKDLLPAKGLPWSDIEQTIAVLAFGRHGSGGGIRLTEAIVVAAAVLTGIAASLRRRAAPLARAAAIELTIALVLYIAISLVKLELFQVRYATMFIPLAIVMFAALLAPLLRRTLVVGAFAVVLVVAGVGDAVFRLGREYEPNTGAVVALVRSLGYRTIQTNSSIVAFYGRGLHVVLDRPFGMGEGRPQCGTCVVIDDKRFGGVRPGHGPQHYFGPILVRLPPHRPPSAGTGAADGRGARRPS